MEFFFFLFSLQFIKQSVCLNSQAALFSLTVDLERGLQWWAIRAEVRVRAETGQTKTNQDTHTHTHICPPLLHLQIKFLNVQKLSRWREWKDLPALNRAGNQWRFLLAKRGIRRKKKENPPGKRGYGWRGDPACSELPEEALSVCMLLGSAHRPWRSSRQKAAVWFELEKEKKSQLKVCRI